MPSTENLFQNPPVHVEQISVTEGHVLVGGMPHDLQGGVGLPSSIATRIESWLQTANRTAYHLTWKGSKVPRGAQVGDRLIQYASNGLVVTDEWGQEVLGKYSRIERDNGDPQQQEMVIFVPAPGEEIDY